MMSGCSSPAPDDSMKALELCTSMWSLILSHCPGKEVGEVRRVLGASLIEQAADLREEVSMYMCIPMITPGNSISIVQLTIIHYIW